MSSAVGSWSARLRRSKGAVTALALLAGALLAELVARTAFDAPSARPRYVGEILRQDAEGAGGRRLVPDSSMRMTLALGDGAEQTIEHRIGPHGWRGEPFAPQPAAGVLRIGCVGDSNVFGWGVDVEQCWPARLQAELSSAGRQVEVLNLGVPNLDAQEKLAIAQRVAFELGCEIVLFALHFDDLHSPDVVRPRLGGGARALAATRPGENAWLDRLRAVSRCADLVVERYRQGLIARAYLAHRERMLAPGSAELAHVEQVLTELAASAREREVELLGLVLPMPVREGRAFASAKIDAALSRALAAAAIREAPLAEELARCDGELWVHPLDLHLNAQAHAVVAKALARELLSRAR